MSVVILSGCTSPLDVGSAGSEAILVGSYVDADVSVDVSADIDAQIDIDAGSSAGSNAGSNAGSSAGSSAGLEVELAGSMGGDTWDIVDASPPPDCGELTQCGALCAELERDPLNCGGCGRTCVIPNATAVCVAGQCEIERCDSPYIDQDRMIENGCELLNTCMDGVACLTECESEGVTRCDEGVASCLPPPELCDLVDNDCDGQCDEDWRALNCRVGIHRGYGSGEHIYSSDINMVRDANHSLEVENFFYLSQEAVSNSRPVFFCRDQRQRPFLSNQTDCGIGRAPLMNLGFWLAAPACDAAPLYALFKADSGDYFYTTRAMERDYAVGLGYEARGIAGYIWLDR